MTTAFEAASRRAAQSAVNRLTNAVAVFGGGRAVPGIYRQAPANAMALVAGDRPTFTTLDAQLAGIAAGADAVIECGGIRREVTIAERPTADEAGVVRLVLETT